MANIYNIPAGIPFAKALASGLLKQTAGAPETLARYTILLPTNRACETLQDAFLSLAKDKPLLLPKLKAIGNIDDEELSLSIAGHDGIEGMLEIPPAIDPLKRQCLLAELIMKVPSRNDSPANALQLASALASLMDQIHTEGLSLEALKDIVPDDFAQHWQITLDFFQILNLYWPKILEEEQAIDPAARRNLLIRTLSNHWQKHPPARPIIAAGSTGTIPATRDLLKTIANLPNGSIILPGLDPDIPHDHWQDLAPIHPQTGLKNLIDHCETAREEVLPWDQNITEHPISISRRALARAIFNTEISENPNHLQQAYETLPIYETDNEQEEATLIALLIRESIETEKQTCTLITPDRNLARRIIAICKRWNINIDDSSGSPLLKTKTATFFRLIIECWQQAYTGHSLLNLLKHDLCFPNHEPGHMNQAIWEIEQHILTCGKEPTLSELINHFKTTDQDNGNHALNILDALNQIIKGSNEDKYNNINNIIENHLKIFDALSDQNNNEHNADAARKNTENTIKTKLKELSKQSVSFKKISLQDYKDIFDTILSSEAIRQAYGTHPRVKILGQIEARMIDTDLLILAGLNEGTWPADDSHDPWMSRPMRKDFGLPSSDQNISLSAHDFTQGICQKNTIITRSKLQSRSPTRPSRWLQTLSMITEKYNFKINKYEINQRLEWSQDLNKKTQTITIDRPAPKPPCASRPQKLSVTAIETWLKDPYALYAKHILKLKKLPSPNDDNKAALKGTIIHDTLDHFIKNTPSDIPKNAPELLIEEAQAQYQKSVNDPALWSFWETQLRTAFIETINNETTWRNKAKPLKTEEKGEITLTTQNNKLTLTARADRIDGFISGSQETRHASQPKAAIIDYKSGGNFTQKHLKKGNYPQLILEALILSKGGFQNLPPMDTDYLGYWLISGGNNAGKKIEIDSGIKSLIDTVHDKITTLIDIYADPNTSYLSIPNPNNQPRYNDYLHLARVQEWSNHLGDDSEGFED